MKYYCVRCNDKFTKLYELQNHLNSFNICEDTLKCNKSIDRIRSVLENYPEFFKIEQNISESSNISKIFEIYEFTNNYTQFQFNICTYIGLLKTEITSLKETRHLPKSDTILDFGSEDISYIDADFLNSCFTDIKNGLIKLIEKIYFNEEYPDNINIKLRSSTYRTIFIYRDKKWITECMVGILPIMLKKSATILLDFYKANLLDDKFIDAYLNAILNNKRSETSKALSSLRCLLENHRY
jgi:hypothetical protein